MNDDELDRIEKRVRDDADMHNRMKNLEARVDTDLAQVGRQLSRITNAIWAGAAYLAVRVIDFILGGGAMK